MTDEEKVIERIVQEVLARMEPRVAPALSASGALRMAPADLAPYIDHTLLKPEATEEQVDVLCDEAVRHRFHSVCVNASWVGRCARKLGGTGVRVCAVVGFPLGAVDSRVKAFEARTAVSHGAAEIDMVMNIGALKAGNLKAVR
ncbi:MAG TPA: deoxyribose-phosphate aldolase, partial [Magnetospirillaceae bacterium]|nr:deoxyribose-phosphate aldolase [Magnetospirillaceae bacterium]